MNMRVIILASLLPAFGTHLFGSDLVREMHQRLRSTQPDVTSVREIAPIDMKSGILGVDCKITSSSTVVLYNRRNTRCVVYRLNKDRRGGPFIATCTIPPYIKPVFEFYDHEWRRVRAEVGERSDWDDNLRPRVRGWIPDAAVFMVLYADSSLGVLAKAADERPIGTEGTVTFAPRFVAEAESLR